MLPPPPPSPIDYPSPISPPAPPLRSSSPRPTLASSTASQNETFFPRTPPSPVSKTLPRSTSSTHRLGPSLLLRSRLTTLNRIRPGLPSTLSTAILPLRSPHHQQEQHPLFQSTPITRARRSTTHPVLTTTSRRPRRSFPLACGRAEHQLSSTSFESLTCQQRTCRATGGERRRQESAATTTSGRSSIRLRRRRAPGRSTTRRNRVKARVDPIRVGTPTTTAPTSKAMTDEARRPSPQRLPSLPAPAAAKPPPHPFTSTRPATERISGSNLLRRSERLMTTTSQCLPHWTTSVFGGRTLSWRTLRSKQQSERLSPLPKRRSGDSDPSSEGRTSRSTSPSPPSERNPTDRRPRFRSSEPSRSRTLPTSENPLPRRATRLWIRRRLRRRRSASRSSLSWRRGRLPRLRRGSERGQ